MVHSPVKRTALRTSMVTVIAVFAVLFGASGAHAATSYQSVSADAGYLMAEVWFNSGTHNMSKGRNSFTLKDHDCNNGWDARVEWKGRQVRKEDRPLW